MIGAADIPGRLGLWRRVACGEGLIECVVEIILALLRRFFGISGFVVLRVPVAIIHGGLHVAISGREIRLQAHNAAMERLFREKQKR